MKLRRTVVIVLILVLFSCACIRKAGEEQNGGKKESTNEVISTETLIFYNCKLIDGTGNNPKENVRISVKDGRITDINENPSADENIAGSRVIDLNGAVLLPGLINAHVHNSYNEEQLQNWLKGGVTTVRDLAPRGSSNAIEDRNGFNQNVENACIVSGNPILSPPGGYGQASYTSIEEAKQRVNEFTEKGYNIIKFSIEDDLMGQKWNMPTYDEVKALVDTAHENNKKITVHISHERNLQWAIDAGVDDIAHMVVEPLDSKTLEAIIQREIYWVPTLELWKGVSEMHDLDWIKIAVANLAAFYQLGGKIALGTDFGGYSCEFDKGLPITEMHLMQEAGMTNMDIIVAATKNAAYVCGLEQEAGTIEVGKKADFLIVNGDPLSNIDDLSNVKMVVHNGVIAYEQEQE